jgi:ATP-dependent RNA helicase RhlE
MFNNNSQGDRSNSGRQKPQSLDSFIDQRGGRPPSRFGSNGGSRGGSRGGFGSNNSNRNSGNSDNSGYDSFDMNSNSGSSRGGFGGGYSSGGSRGGDGHNRFKRRFGQSHDKGSFRPKRPKFASSLLYSDPAIFRKVAAPKPMYDLEVTKTFADFKLDSELNFSLERRGYTSPTWIQSEIIQPALEVKNLLGLAETGSGKTGAFLIPLINRTLEHKARKEPFQTLILAPTRDLAIQIEQELFSTKTKRMELQACICVGGSSMERQIQKLRSFNHFVIGTPGRVKDLMNQGILKLGTFKAVVLDEADRMLEMGFVEDIQEILDNCPADAQKMFFSATMDKKVEPLIKNYLGDYVKVQSQPTQSSDNVHQDYITYTSEDERITKLIELLNTVDVTKTIIFTQTKMTADNLHYELRKNSMKSEALHGDKSMYIRKSVITKFKESAIDILVATDVAARGLDIKGVTTVINFDLPENFDTYIHRIGRTGRAGNIGYAYTFVRGSSRY